MRMGTRAIPGRLYANWGQLFHTYPLSLENYELCINPKLSIVLSMPDSEMNLMHYSFLLCQGYIFIPQDQYQQ